MTANISLRPVNKSDIRYFAIWWRDKDLAKLTSGILTPISNDELEEYFLGVTNNNSSYHFMIVANSVTIGHMSLSKKEEGWYETQIIIGDKEYLGYGYGPKAINLLVSKAKKLHIKKLFLEVRPTNMRAIKAYMQCGFIKDKTILYPENKHLPETLRMVRLLIP
jgi:RimJ/RimL family protein N-acetyltransferase